MAHAELELMYRHFDMTHTYTHQHRQSLVAIASTDAAGPLFTTLTEPPLSTATLCPGHQAARQRALEASRMAGPSDATTNITIRCFRPEDAEAVRALVATGRAGAAAGRYVL